ncbi:MAG: hypothetical protein WCO66_03055 [Candidatus Absconditabacteria bacterium]
MFMRMRNCRQKHKTRTIISGALFIFFFIPSLANIIGNIKEHKAELVRQEAYNKAPTPTIEILSQSGNIGDSTGYTLVYKTTDSTKVIVGNQTFSGNDKENSVNFSLNGTGKTSLSILLMAKNEYKSTEKNIVITRNKTAEEVRIENEEKERIANEQAQGEINILEGYIKEMKEGYSFYDVATISTTAYRLEALWGLIKTDLDSQNTKIVQKAKETKTKLISTQKLVFPKLRAERCSLTKNTMWEYNVDVKCYGGTVKFIGGTFASNSNIKDSYLAVSDMLDLLRFKKASFYWYEGSDYTYYTIDSPSDGTLE